MLTPYAKKLLEQKAAAPAPEMDSSAPARAATPAALDRYGEWMRPREVSEYLRASRTHVTALRDSGALTFINISSSCSTGQGADWRISKASVAAFEARRKTIVPPSNP